MKHRSAAGLAGLVLALLLAAPAAGGSGERQRPRRGRERNAAPQTPRVTTRRTAPTAGGRAATRHDARAARDRGRDRRRLGPRAVHADASSASTHESGTEPDSRAEWARPTATRYESRQPASAATVLGDGRRGPDAGRLLRLALDSAARLRCDLDGVPAQAPRRGAITVDVSSSTRSTPAAPARATAAPVGGATVRVGAASRSRRPTAARRSTVTAERGSRGRRGRPRAVGNLRRAADDGSVGDVAAARRRPTRTAPTASILGIRDGQRFTRRRAPRELQRHGVRRPVGPVGGQDPPHAPARRHVLVLLRQPEQFLKRTCGKQYAFKVGDRADWSYLLPAAPAARPLRARHLRDRQRVQPRRGEPGGVPRPMRRRSVIARGGRRRSAGAGVRRARSR